MSRQCPDTSMLAVKSGLVVRVDDIQQQVFAACAAFFTALSCRRWICTFVGLAKRKVRVTEPGSSADSPVQGSSQSCVKKGTYLRLGVPFSGILRLRHGCILILKVFEGLVGFRRKGNFFQKFPFLPAAVNSNFMVAFRGNTIPEYGRKDDELRRSSGLRCHRPGEPPAPEKLGDLAIFQGVGDCSAYCRWRRRPRW